MGDMRDQLRKANLISKKDAKRLAHEDRVERSQSGGAAGVDQKRTDHQAELEQVRAGRRAADRAAGVIQKAEQSAAAERAACIELLAREVQKPAHRGASRWYFQCPDGSLPALQLPAVERMQLQGGTLCVVRIGPPGSHDYGLLATVHARRIAAAMPERVLFVPADAPA